MKQETTVKFEEWFKQMTQATKAKEYLQKLISFNGHTDAYEWLNDKETQKLFDEIRNFLNK